MDRLSALKTIDIYGVDIAQTSISNLIHHLEAKLLANDIKGFITVTGVHGIIESQKNKKVAEAHNNSYLSIPDGTPLVWYSKSKGSKSIKRCFGPEMMYQFFKKTSESNFKHFFYGGNEGVGEKLKSNFENEFNSNIVGTYCPPFRPLNKKENQELKSLIKKTKPDIIWVGLSTPKQELFMNEYIDQLDCKLMFGVGAAFDYHTGSIVVAPKLVQKMGLEWLFRITLEPRRLYKRYFEIVPKFIILFLKELLFKKNKGD